MRRARLFGEVVSKISIVAFDALVARVMAPERYRSVRRVFWVADSGTISARVGELAQYLRRPGFPPFGCRFARYRSAAESDVA